MFTYVDIVVSYTFYCYIIVDAYNQNGEYNCFRMLE